MNKPRKPEKKKCRCYYSHNLDKCQCKGYNQCYDELEAYYQAWLPDEEEIADIIYSLKNNRGELPPDSTIAKAISKRIRG